MESFAAGVVGIVRDAGAESPVTRIGSAEIAFADRANTFQSPGPNVISDPDATQVTSCELSQRWNGSPAAAWKRQTSPAS